MRIFGLLLCFCVLFSFVLSEDEFDAMYKNIFDEEPEEIVLHVDEVKDWIGNETEEDQDPNAAKKREDHHAVGMCWQSEMARCINDCQNSTLSIEIVQEICASYCQADISWTCTQLNLEYGGTEIFKFSGRWPFKRVLCFTEFGSVLFCTLSVFMHLFYVIQYINATDLPENVEEVYPYRKLWIVTHFVWMITFLCAAMFHTVDIRLTEYLDYFTAMLAALFGLWATLVRVFEVKRSSVMWLLAVPLVGFYGFHIMRMVGIHFSYGYNMKATIGFLIANAVLWGVWAILNVRSEPQAKWVVVGHMLLGMFSVLEIFDNPPLWGIFDTHAFWHLSINVIFFFWNQFYIRDTLHYRKNAETKKE